MHEGPWGEALFGVTAWDGAGSPLNRQAGHLTHGNPMANAKQDFIGFGEFASMEHEPSSPGTAQ